jgi:hypothetical protein
MPASLIRRCAALVAALASLVCGAAAAGQVGDSVILVIAGQPRALSGRVLDSLSGDSATARDHHGPPARYVGVALDRLLDYAGVSASGLRGAQLERVLVIEARDGYRVSFGGGEVDPTVTGRSILLVRAAGPDGPWRLVVPGDARGARWVRQVQAIRLLEQPRDGG